jgi:hypothetical protein
MALTYLSLVNKVLAKFNEVQLTSSTFASATGFHMDVKNSVNYAINDINSVDWEWPFNYALGSQTCVAGQQEYDLPATTKSVDWESFYIYKDGTVSEVTKNLPYVDFDQWLRARRETDYNADATAEYSIPDAVFRPQGSLKFGVTPKPNAAFVIKYDYWVVPTALSAYTDTTTVPDTYEQVIIDGATSYGYDFRDNIEGATKYGERFKDGINKMRRILIPQTVRMRTTQIVRAYGVDPRRWDY